jgi:hypothetical protein
MIEDMGAMDGAKMAAMSENMLDRALAPVFAVVRRIAAPALRYSLGLVLLWIGL